MEMQEKTKMNQDFLCLCLTYFIWPAGGGTELYVRKQCICSSLLFYVLITYDTGHMNGKCSSKLFINSTKGIHKNH